MAQGESWEKYALDAGSGAVLGLLDMVPADAFKGPQRICAVLHPFCRDKEWVAAEIRRIFTSCFYFDVEFKLRLSKVRFACPAAASANLAPSLGV